MPNDPRGSWSSEIRSYALAKLGEPHWGRKKVQPSRQVLRTFHQLAQRELAHHPLWFDAPQRATIAQAIAEAVAQQTLTCWACAVLEDHLHLLVRIHRLDGDQLLALFKGCTREALVTQNLVPPDRPVFSDAKCDVYKRSPAEIESCINYIWDNFAKHGLSPQRYPFVKDYDGWPLKGRRTQR